MQIVALKLRNYRNFQDIAIKNIPRFAVFVGANGTGKTTLFDHYGNKDYLEAQILNEFNLIPGLSS